MIKRIIVLLGISIILTGCQSDTANEQKENIEQKADINIVDEINESLKDDTPTKTAVLKMYFPDGNIKEFLFEYYKQKHNHSPNGYECEYYEHDYITPVVYIRDASVFYRTVTKDDDIYNVFNGTFTIDLPDEE